MLAYLYRVGPVAVRHGKAWGAALGPVSTVDDRLMYRRDLFIGGAWVPPARGAHVEVISPSTQAPVGSVPLATDSDFDRAVVAARNAFDSGPWPRMTPGERADVLAQAADHLSKRAAE